jgi:hypothetical protein
MSHVRMGIYALTAAVLALLCARFADSAAVLTFAYACTESLAPMRNSSDSLTRVDKTVRLPVTGTGHAA